MTIPGNTCCLHCWPVAVRGARAALDVLADVQTGDDDRMVARDVLLRAITLLSLGPGTPLGTKQGGGEP